MKTIIRKLFWPWDFDKEELWLNEMSAKGLGLSSVGYCRYEFTPCEKGEYNYRIELLENMPTHPESVQYIKFMEDSGIEQVGSYNRWVYFRKKSDDIPFDIFSDAPSRIKHLDRILLLLGILGAVNIYNGFYNILMAVSGSGVFAVNFSAGALCCLVGGLFAYGYYKIWKKKDFLKKEHQICE